MQNKDFSSLGLMPASLRALEHEGYEVPTPIQTRAIPPALEGRDLLACAQTGTGKTAAFALPVIQRLVATPRRPGPRQVRALVVAPTRELAAQIDEGFAAYGRHAGLRRACVFGGVGKAPQVKQLTGGVDVLVATPGRLLDLASDGALSLSSVEIAVFDEADRMLDMGFIRDVRKIVAMLPSRRQTLLFSATMPPEIESLARGLLTDPVRIAVDPEKPAVERIRQTLYRVEKAAKRELLAKLLGELDVGRAIVFSRTKHGADRIAKSLHAAGVPAGVIHANKGQGNRTRTMDAFRAGTTRILVATDIAARGIDVDDITHVFNFDLPTEPETYVHRIGRTARAGADGFAVSFCDVEEEKQLRQIERLLKKPIPVAGYYRAESDASEAPVAPGNAGAARGGERRTDGGASRSGRRGPRGTNGSAKPSRAEQQDRPDGRAPTARRGHETHNRDSRRTASLVERAVGPRYRPMHREDATDR